MNFTIPPQEAIIMMIPILLIAAAMLKFKKQR